MLRMTQDLGIKSATQSYIEVKQVQWCQGRSVTERWPSDDGVCAKIIWGWWDAGNITSFDTYTYTYIDIGSYLKFSFNSVQIKWS